MKALQRFLVFPIFPSADVSINLESSTTSLNHVVIILQRLERSHEGGEKTKSRAPCSNRESNFPIE